MSKLKLSLFCLFLGLGLISNAYTYAQAIPNSTKSNEVLKLLLPRLNLQGEWITLRFADGTQMASGATGDMGAATYDPQTIAGDAFDLAVHTGAIAHDSAKITGTGTYPHASIDTHIDDTTDPHGATLTQTAATIAGVAAPYIAQTNGTGTGITLAGNTNMPSGIWNSSGNVGIGTSTPATKLHVIGTFQQENTPNAFMRLKSTNAARKTAAYQLVDNTDTVNWSLYNDPEALNVKQFSIWDEGSGTARLNIKADGSVNIPGNVGIGTTTPGVKLDINGGIRIMGESTPANGVGIELHYRGSGYGDIFAYDRNTSSAKDLRFSQGNILFTGGNVGIGTTTPANRLHVVSPNMGGIRLDRTGGDANTRNWFMATSNQVEGDLNILQSNTAGGDPWSGTSRLYIKNDGNVGIGTAAPGAKLDIIHAGEVGFSLNSGASGSYSRLDMGRTTRDLTIGVVGNNDNFLPGTVPGDAVIRALTSKLFLGDNSGMGIVLSSGNVGIGTTTPSNILTLPIASATDPIADSWTNHCLADYKDIGTQTTEMIQISANEKIKSVPVSVFTKKAMISDEEAERAPKQKYQDKIRESAKADLELYTAETGVAMNSNSYVDELVNSMWETKADRLAIVETNKQKLIAEKKALPKFQRQQYGIVAEDAPPEAQVFDKNGNLQGVNSYPLISMLWANAQKQDERIAQLETQIIALTSRVNMLEGR